MRDRSERGTVTVFVVVLMLALFMVAGLVLDGGRLLAARREAANIAESAARAGAQELDTAATRDAGTVRLNPIAARSRAEDYLATNGYTGSVSVNGEIVHVEVTISRDLFLLSLGGLTDASVTARGDARGARGIREEDD